mgnify:CR=1 FL=1
MKKNKSWILCNFKDLEGVRVYKVKDKYVLTNYRDEAFCVFSFLGSSVKRSRLFADFIGTGFADAFWGYMCGRDDSKDSLECFLCLENYRCFNARSGSPDCLIAQQIERDCG